MGCAASSTSAASPRATKPSRSSSHEVIHSDKLTPCDDDLSGAPSAVPQQEHASPQANATPAYDAEHLAPPLLSAGLPPLRVSRSTSLSPGGRTTTPLSSPSRSDAKPLATFDEPGINGPLAADVSYQNFFGPAALQSATSPPLLQGNLSYEVLEATRPLPSSHGAAVLQGSPARWAKRPPPLSTGDGSAVAAPAAPVRGWTPTTQHVPGLLAAPLARSYSPSASNGSSPLQSVTTAIFRDMDRSAAGSPSPYNPLTAVAGRRSSVATTTTVGSVAARSHVPLIGRFVTASPLLGDGLIGDRTIPLVDSSDEMTARPSPVSRSSNNSSALYNSSSRELP